MMNHVSKHHKERAFPSIDYNISNSNNQESPIDRLSK
jgi:hypothetical protein